MRFSALRSNLLYALFCLSVALCLPVFARADDNTPLFYSRTNISLIRHHVPPLPWASGAPAEIPPLTFDVEIRDGMSLYKQEGWFNLSSPSQKNGVMLAFAAPSVSPIIRSQQYAPLDVLFIDRQGKITQIIPNVMLSELEQDIYPTSPVLAFLFLKGGTCASLMINPGDEVEYTIFKRPPVILSVPEAPAPVPTAPLTQPPAAPQPAPSKKDSK